MHEARERHAGGEPERALLHREEGTERPQLLHRVARRGGGVERLDQRVLAEPGEVGGDDERPVDAEPAADAGEEERRRATDRSDDGADGEEGDEAVAVGAGALAVSAVDRDAVDAEASEQHPEVLGVAGRRGRLEQAAGDLDPGHVGRHSEPGEVDLPRRRVEEVVLRDEVGDLQVVDGAGEAEQRHRPVEEQGDAVDPLRRHLHAEADLLQVQGAEALLDGDPPRSVAVAGAERDVHRVVVVLLDGECRARTSASAVAARCRRRCRRRCCCRPDAPSAATARPVSWICTPAPVMSPLGEADLGERVEGNRLDGDTEVDQRAGQLADSQADTVDGECRREARGRCRRS